MSYKFSGLLVKNVSDNFFEEFTKSFSDLGMEIEETSQDNEEYRIAVVVDENKNAWISDIYIIPLLAADLAVKFNTTVYGYATYETSGYKAIIKYNKSSTPEYVSVVGDEQYDIGIDFEKLYDQALKDTSFSRHIEEGIDVFKYYVPEYKIKTEVPDLEDFMVKVARIASANKYIDEIPKGSVVKFFKIGDIYYENLAFYNNNYEEVIHLSRKEFVMRQISHRLNKNIEKEEHRKGLENNEKNKAQYAKDYEKNQNMLGIVIGVCSIISICCIFSLCILSIMGLLNR